MAVETWRGAVSQEQVGHWWYAFNSYPYSLAPSSLSAFSMQWRVYSSHTHHHHHDDLPRNMQPRNPNMDFLSHEPKQVTSSFKVLFQVFGHSYMNVTNMRTRFFVFFFKGQDISVLWFQRLPDSNHRYPSPVQLGLFIKWGSSTSGWSHEECFTLYIVWKPKA